MIQKVATPNISNDHASEQRMRSALPASYGSREAVVAQASSYQEVRMPPAQIQSSAQPLTQSNSLAGMLDSLKMPSHDMASLAATLKSPLAPSAEQAPMASTPLQSQFQERSAAPEQSASAMQPAQLGNIWTDLKKGVNPILQFTKELLSIVSASFIASINFLFKAFRK